MSLFITEYPLSHINLQATDLFPLKFPLYNRIFTLTTLTVSSEIRYTFSIEIKFIITELLTMCQSIWQSGQCLLHEQVSVTFDKGGSLWNFDAICN